MSVPIKQQLLKRIDTGRTEIRIELVQYKENDPWFIDCRIYQPSFQPGDPELYPTRSGVIVRHDKIKEVIETLTKGLDMLDNGISSPSLPPAVKAPRVISCGRVVPPAMPAYSGEDKPNPFDEKTAEELKSHFLKSY